MVRYYEFCRLNEGRRLAIFNTDEINAILKRAKAGESFESISKTFNFHRSTIEKVVKDNITPEEYAAINKLSNNRSIKFTDDQINDILKRVRTSEPFLSISKDFSCTTQTIATAVKKNTTPEEYAEIVAVNRKPKLVLTDEQIKDVISRAKNGESFESIAKDFNYSGTTLGPIIKNNVSSEEYAEIIKKLSGTTPDNLVKKGVTLELAKKWGEAFAAGNSLSQVATMSEPKVKYTTVVYWLKKLPNYEELKRLHDEKVEHQQAMTDKTPRPGTMDNQKSKGPGSRHTQGVDWPNYNKGGE